VTGGCQGELKEFLKDLKKSLIIKDEDKETTHPMEAERQERKRAKERAAAERTGRNGLARPVRPIGHFATAPINYNDFAIQSIKEDLELLKSKYVTEPTSTLSNSIIFVTGDCGIGSRDEKYYIDLLEKCNKILSYNNAYILFVRGNNDNPAFFDGEKIDLSNIKAVPDYSVVEAVGKNILCIGGAISTDRLWKKEQEKRINQFKSDCPKMLYWEDEAPIIDKDKMDEIFKEYDKIDYVISHSSPSFTNPTQCQGIEEWEKTDANLKKDIQNERVTMDRIFEYLRDNDRKPAFWTYGHFNFAAVDMRSGTIFNSLNDGFSPVNITSLIDIFSSRDDKSKKVKKKLSTPFTRIAAPDNNPWAVDNIAANEIGQAEEPMPEEEKEDAPADVDAPMEIHAVENEEHGEEATIEIAPQNEPRRDERLFANIPLDWFNDVRGYNRDDAFAQALYNIHNANARVEPAVNRAAYVDADGDIFTLRAVNPVMVGEATNTATVGTINTR
jgi:hypothetical protein